MNKLRWQWYNLKRLNRKWVNMPASERRLIEAVGVWWLWRHGVVREHKIYPWNNKQWYAPDLCIPKRKLIVEVDGVVHDVPANKRRDIVRDITLAELGWRILRINDRETRTSPRAVKERVARFLKGY